MKTRKIICLYGGPGCGKSVVCAGLYYHLKIMGYECEMNREYIKEWAWEKRSHKSGDQSYFFAKMARKERIYIDNKLDFIITDSPLILCHFYGMKFDKFEQLTNTSLSMLKNHHQYCIEAGYKVDHFLLKRTARYSPAGRYQTEEQAKEIDLELLQMLEEMKVKYHTVDADLNCVLNIINILKDDK
jgi:thymidylate kinase